jgi:hypothetical protein
MLESSLIQSYVNNFRRHLAQYLKPGIGLRCDVYRALSGGAVIAFTLSPTEENDDTFHPDSATVSDALANVEQKAFGGDLSGFIFRGTNTILEGNRLIFIKDESSTEWSDSSSRSDVERVVDGQTGGAR